MPLLVPRVSGFGTYEFTLKVGHFKKECDQMKELSEKSIFSITFGGRGCTHLTLMDLPKTSVTLMGNPGHGYGVLYLLLFCCRVSRYILTSSVHFCFKSKKVKNNEVMFERMKMFFF